MSRGNRPDEIKPCDVISGIRRRELICFVIRSHGNKSAGIKPCDIIRSSGIRRSELTLGSNRSRGFSQGEILKS